MVTRGNSEAYLTDFEIFQRKKKSLNYLYFSSHTFHLCFCSKIYKYFKNYLIAEFYFHVNVDKIPLPRLFFLANNTTLKVN